MAVISGAAELLIELDPSEPLREQIEERLRRAIREGRLAPGARLPATRTLAEGIGCSRWTVVEAYSQLAAEGYLRTRVGSGTRVAPLASVGAQTPTALPATPSRAQFDLEPGAPDLVLFPRVAWTKALAVAVREADPAVLDYPDPGGIPALRATLCEYLGRVRGVLAVAPSVQVCAGAAHGIGLICRALASTGRRRLAVEDPGWPTLRPFAEQAGLALVPVDVDDEGLSIEHLMTVDADAVLVTPAHQYPLGSVLSAQRRRALLDWADGRNGLIIEDDYDVEYRYDRRPVGAMQGVSPQHVAYVGSVSKTLAPALRLGWIVTPPSLQDPLCEARAGTDIGSTSALDQLALVAMLATGAYDRHLRRTRLEYRRRRQALLNALAQHMPDMQVLGVAAGLHLLATLPAGCDEEQLVDEAARAGLRLKGLSSCWLREPTSFGLVLGYARMTASQLEHAVQELARIARAPTEVKPAS